ncbi:MAG: hypothetical protein JWQ09_1749 [Segetibacter sp.]|nr:hypothetical protein [Segetibacter sp.]
MDNIHFTRKELYDLVWKEPLLSLSKKYDISDVGLRKACMRMNIPLPKAGHWQKLRYGKKSPVKALPKDYTGDEKMILRLRPEGESIKRPSQKSILSELQKEIESDPKLDMRVPEKLTNPDKLIIEARNSLTERSKYLNNGLAWCSIDHLSIKVSPGNISRALRFMDKFIKVLKIRGHEVYVRHDSTYVVIEKEEIMISLRESLKRELVDDGRWKTAKDTPTGLLCLKMGRYNDKEWKDGKQTLEEQLSQIIVRLETEGKQLRERSLRREKERLEAQETERIRKELEKRQEKELEDFKGILQQASRLHKATTIRTYIDKVEAHAAENGNVTEEIMQWLAWARKKADWYDPLIECEDDLLKDIDRDTLAFKKKMSNSWWG